jgi:hypothetical protein
VDIDLVARKAAGKKTLDMSQNRLHRRQIFIHSNVNGEKLFCKEQSERLHTPLKPLSPWVFEKNLPADGTVSQYSALDKVNTYLFALKA